MVKTCSMNQNQSDEDDASGRKRFKTRYHNGGATPPWSDINHHVLSIVMMQLGLVDFIAFSGVCKSWRSFAVSERNRFLASRPLMSIYIPSEYKKECYFQDFEGRMFKTIIPHSANSTRIGLTCGYLILFNRETHDFWLVNPITRHELHFPDLVAILIFSPSLSRLVFVVLRRYTHDIWFSIAGKGAWYVLSTSVIYDIHAFKGKIYALSFKPHCCLYEVRLSLDPKLTVLLTLTLLETKYALHKTWSCPWSVSSRENLYVMAHLTRDDLYMVHEIDFGEMKWVLHEKTMGEYSFFVCHSRHGVAVNQKLWAEPWSQYGRFLDTDKSGKGRFFTANMWYFNDECLDVDIIDE